MPGRKYYLGGELFQYDLFSSTVCAERFDSKHLFTEKMIVQPQRTQVRSCGIMGSFDVFGNVIVLTPKVQADEIFAQVPTVFDRNNRCAAGISRLPNDAGLIYKVLAMESHQVRAKIREFWSVVRLTVTGHQVPPEFAWR